jgi:quinol monooxygenase YgiN
MTLVGDRQTTAEESNPNSKASEHVYWLITTNVKDGQLENLKKINTEMVTNTKINESGTLTYDWSISADGKTC